ncbi:histidine phosphatase family protein [Patescibacteria group bacterium]|nr:histidine phosphatase family protein [Patescibacteria group bacterium]
MKSKFAKIFLVRHGEVINHKNIIYGYLPLPLSAKGKAQARKAGIILKRKSIGVIFASPQKRAQQTAKIIKKTLGGKIKIITDKDLHESAFGHFTEGLTKQEAKEKYPKQYYLYYRQPAKSTAGETLKKMAERMLKAINKGIKKYPGQNLIFVSHQDPIAVVLLKLSKRDFNDIHKVKAICDPGSICEVWSVEKRLINKTYLAN